jgi:hypothetical protein
MHALALETLNTTLFVLLGTTPPVQFALSVHKPVLDGLAAGFQMVVVSWASEDIWAKRNKNKNHRGTQMDTDLRKAK